MKRLLPLLLLVAVLVPAPARAATKNVTVGNNFFSPSTLVAAAGDTINWNWDAYSSLHTVTAYSGATFDSGNKSSGTYSVAYGGGTVLYYCKIHASVGGGVCSGSMCAKITDDTAPPPAPAITQPAPGATVASGSVAIAGTASSDSVKVRLRRNMVTLEDVPVAAGQWSTTLGFANGSHTISATAFDAAGNESSAATVTFTVGDNVPPPAPAIAEPAADVAFRSRMVRVAGTSSDDTTLVRVLEGAEVVGSIASAGGVWGAQLNFTDGYHTIVARALDGAGNVGPASASVRFLVDSVNPTISMSSPKALQVVVGAVTISGSASDNIGVSSVVARAANRATGAAITIPAPCTGCGGTAATWSVSATLPSGIYDISATVTDLAANTALATPVTIIVV